MTPRYKTLHAINEGKLPKLTRSTADEHEVESAKAGEAAECCGAGNEKRGSRKQR